MTGTMLAVSMAFATGAPPFSFQIGLLSLVVTFMGNGTHSSFAKCAGKDVSPTVYTLYLSCGLFLVCSVVVAAMAESFVITVPGILGGVLLCVSVSCYINAVMLVGIVWCDMLTASAATVVSFFMGKVYFQEPSTHALLAVAGLCILLAGILGISFVLWRRLQQLDTAERLAEGFPLIIGLMFALSAGTFGGTCFAVNKLQPSDQQGIRFVWAQALGMLGTQIVFVVLGIFYDLYYIQSAGYKKHDSANLPTVTNSRLVLGKFAFGTEGMLGVAQGAVLAFTNLTTTIAAMSPIGIGVAQPVREAGHMLAVIIGTLWFKEYGKVDSPFLVSLVCLAAMNLAGIIMLIAYGSAPF